MIDILQDKAKLSMANANNTLQFLIVEYARICAEEKVSPLHIMRNIQNHSLALENISLGEDYCRALGRFLPVTLLNFISVIVNLGFRKS